MKSVFKIVMGAMALCVAVSCFAAAPAAKAKGKTDKRVQQVQQAQALVQAGKFPEAYSLLQPLEFDLAGDVQYDYLLGVSAVNSGKPDRATIALERVSAINQSYGDARQWLAIAYFQSGDMERAKTEFNFVLTQNPTPQVKATADQYLAAIKQQDDAKELAEKKAHQPYLLGMVELGAGRDSNIMSAPGDPVSAYFVTAGLPDTVRTDTAYMNALASSLPTGISDSFALANANIEGRVPFSGAGTYGYVSFDSTNRAYNANAMMNSHTNLLKGGVNLISGRHTYRFDFSRRDYRQDGKGASQGFPNDNAQNSIAGDARFTLGDRDYLGINLQRNTPRFTKIPSQDTNQVVLGTNYTHVFPYTGSPMLYFALNHTRDRAVSQSTPYGIMTDVSRNTNAFIVYSQYTFVESADVTAMWMSSRRNDSSPFARSAVLAYGKDEMRVAMLGVNWRPAKDWTVKPQLMRIQNASNIPLYSYTKNEISVSVKREFK